MYDSKADLGVLYRGLQPQDRKWIKWKSRLKIATHRKPILKPPKAVARKLPVRYVAANYRSDALHGSHCRWVWVAGWFYSVRGFSIRPSWTTLTIVLRTRQMSLLMRKWKRLDRSSEVWGIYRQKMQINQNGTITGFDLCERYINEKSTEFLQCFCSPKYRNVEPLEWLP